MAYQMGGAAKQKAVVEYMKERTVGGKDVLDPTGREPRIYPSKATGFFCFFLLFFPAQNPAPFTLMSS